MKRKDYHIGPGAVSLLLVVVIVSMSVLGLLALISARSNYKLTERAVAFAVAERTASANAERTLAELDAIVASCAEKAEDDAEYLRLIAEELPVGMQLEERIVSWLESAGNGRVLQCAVEVQAMGDSPRVEWTMHAFVAENGDI